jgi:uncharacterized protein YndB with AHSA1/START domain
LAIIDKEVTVNAPVDAIFSYVANPGNWPEFWPSLVKVRDVEPLPNGGYKAKYQFKMAGRFFSGAGEYIKFIPNMWIVLQTKGGIKSEITWTFRPMGNKTKVWLVIEYKIPIPLLGFLAEPIISEMNSQNADSILKNLQTRFMLWNVFHEG